MSFANHFNDLSTDELVERLKRQLFKVNSQRNLLMSWAKRPGIAFIQATDSTEVTLEKARAAIRRIEQSNF